MERNWSFYKHSKGLAVWTRYPTPFCEQLGHVSKCCKRENRKAKKCQDGKAGVNSSTVSLNNPSSGLILQAGMLPLVFTATTNKFTAARFATRQWMGRHDKLLIKPGISESTMQEQPSCLRARPRLQRTTLGTPSYHHPQDTTVLAGNMEQPSFLLLLSQ